MGKVPRLGQFLTLDTCLGWPYTCRLSGSEAVMVGSSNYLNGEHGIMQL
jgi:hypothetical protein